MLPSTPEYYCFPVLIFRAFWSLLRFRLAATSDFLIGRLIARNQSQSIRRLLLSCSLLIDVALILSYFPRVRGETISG
jgi:hypothetical protein